MITVLIFLAVLFVLILVHEWGHFITAKLTGMRVDEFAIGFPPKLFSWKRGETEYSLNALPIGGFVRIYGEDPTQVAAASADSARAFGSRPKWAQAIVLVAGVTMNVAFAWFLFVIMLTTGVPTQVEEQAATAEAKMVVSGILPKSPADGTLIPNSIIISAQAGEDTLISIKPSTFSEFMSTHADTPVTIGYTGSDGEIKSVAVTPKKGLIAASPERAAIGVQLSYVEVVARPFGEAIVEAGQLTVASTLAITNGLWDLIKGAFAGTADFSQVAGPIGIVNYVGDAAAVGFTSLLYFTAIISLNLAVINLLPIPALDGGRLVFVAIEAVTRRPIPPVWAARVNLAGFAFLMLLMIAATIGDIYKLF